MGYSYDVTCNVFKWKQENIPVLQLEEMCTGIATKPRLQLESQKKNLPSLTQDFIPEKQSV